MYRSNKNEGSEKSIYPIILKTENSVYYASFMSSEDFGISNADSDDYIYIPIEPEIIH